MSGADPVRVQELFIAACELDAPERAAYLAEACAGDATLRAAVDALLAHDDDEHALFSEREVAEGFLIDASALASTASRSIIEGLPAPAERIGRYTIGRRLGAGGMGTVYEAEQDEPRRTVALKVLAARDPDGALLDRFRHEAAVLGRLQHAGIAQVYEAGVFEDESGVRPYFAMELVDGEPLGPRVRGRELDVRERLALIADVCDAVAHAHDKGVVHRDLKPANILVDRDGRPKVLDFGVARVVDAGTTLSSLHTAAGQLVGTLQYMSPEQVSGDPEAVDVRSDVYALGVILYELLAGKPPYDLRRRSIPDAARIIRDEEPHRLSVHDPALRGDVEIVVEQALAKEPQRRYADARALGDDLRRVLADEPIHARPLTTIGFVVRFARRHRSLVAGVVVAFLALIVALVVVTQQRDVARRAQQLAESRGYRNAILAAAGSLDDGEPATARSLLEDTDPAQRGWEWTYLDAQIEDGSVLAQTDASGVAIGLLPDAELFWMLGDDGVLRHVQWADGSVAATFEFGIEPAVAVSSPHGETAFAWCRSPAPVSVLIDTVLGVVVDRRDGPPERPFSMAVADDASFALWSGVPGERKWTRSDEPLSFLEGSGNRAGRWLSLGTSLAMISTYGYGNVVDLRTGKPSRQFHLEGVRPMGITHSRDGARVAVGLKNGTVALMHADASVADRTMDVHVGLPDALAFSPDGSTLFVAGSTGRVELWDVASSTRRATRNGPSDIDALVAADDGCFLARLSDGTVRAWSAAPPTRVLRGHESYVYATAVSADARTVYTGAWDKTVRAWDAATGRALRVFDYPSRVTAIAVSPDGTRLAFGGRRRGGRIVDTDTGELVRMVEGLSGALASLTWSPDGGRLFAGEQRVAKDGAQLLVIDVATGEVTRPIHATFGQSLLGVAVSPDGRRLALGDGDGAIHLFDAQTFAPTRTLEGHLETVTGLAFHPAGTHLVSSSQDETARVWELASGTCVRVLEGHGEWVWTAVYSPDGARIVTGARDGVVRVFDPASPAPLLALRGHDDYVYALSFAPDGRYLVSGSGDATARVWAAAPIGR